MPEEVKQMATKRLNLVAIEEMKPILVENSKPVPIENLELPIAKRIKGDTMGRSCPFCSNKKQVAASCSNQSCKKCCLAREKICPTHPKEVEKSEAMITEFKKRVLRNEFREPNFHYYGETVTIFCVRDFFQSKKLSQGVLNDQGRAERVSGSTCSRRKKRKAVNPEIKKLIASALGKIDFKSNNSDALKRNAVTDTN
ncbi:uncharacterized protein PHALS_01471 [Plasmopara halstedii]|uniref:Uncharacterized protein n=1 Tax=Plasmopara halstedii TaxID=4781 RepID=A0A0P1AWT8_PLAHL|nr:uncharacterized protein PHALS_01471 [Plasmopara halstedii]CEG45153.1 hypothetical protein PHALS_01471 [Plasmopara halstedii]|eukprot:XP_024581522.1 hypothetical protein PHALS_01471 [Plasmopara halstedii]